MNKKYIRRTKHLADYGELIPVEEFDHKLTADVDYYASHYYYNEEHYKEFQKSGSVSGITDVVTDKVIFDFDSVNIEDARKDAVELVSRLKIWKVDTRNNIQIHFSGQKGFSIYFKLDKYITPEEHKHIALNVLGEGLKTLDPRIYNPSRVIRLPRTKHNSTGLYKYGLSENQLRTAKIEQIKEMAKTIGYAPRDLAPIVLPDIAFGKKEQKKERKKVVVNGFDLTNRPRHWKDYKWAIFNCVGLKQGDRTSAMMIIASTCRVLGYPQTLTEHFLNSFDEKYAETTKQDADDNKVQGVLRSVFSETWNGGTYSIKNDPWLRKYVEENGFKSEVEDEFIKISDVARNFTDFSENFEQNLVKTGIEQLDDKVLFLTSTHNGILGQPGSGKTSMALQWLRHSSVLNSPAVFYSLDMAQPIVYGKLVQQEMGKSFRDAMNDYKNDKTLAKLTDISIMNRYKNVSFNFKAGVTPQNIRDDVRRWEDEQGEKVRLLIVDYLECLQGPYSDATANTGFISNQMKDLANELGVCSVMLLQTQKHSTSDISDPLTSMKQIKGSSVIEQASSVILTMWREGYNPHTQDRDKFISLSVVKNRFGELNSWDFDWNGGNGVINPLSDEGVKALRELREFKKKQRIEKDEFGRNWS